MATFQCVFPGCARRSPPCTHSPRAPLPRSLTPCPPCSGKKYAKLLKAAELEAGLDRYEPFITRSRNLPGMLFCALTGELLNARLHEVKQHMKGKKFGRARGESLLR